MMRIHDEVITPLRFKSRREVKRSARVGKTVYDSLYNTKISKRGTKINPYITLYSAN